MALCLLPLLAACGEAVKENPRAVEEQTTLRDEDIPQRVPYADALTIYSLKASEGPPRDLPPDAESFLGYQVLGNYTVVDPTERKAVVRALNRAMAEDAVQNKCFIPRHGFRMTTADTTINYLVCFQCGQYYVGKYQGTGEAISKSAQPLIDGILKNAGVPLNPGQGETE
ncbi:MAG: hypothetical protein QM811_00055 [Pirellulales bacterium]